MFLRRTPEIQVELVCNWDLGIDIFKILAYIFLSDFNGSRTTNPKVRREKKISKGLWCSF